MDKKRLIRYLFSFSVLLQASCFLVNANRSASILSLNGSWEMGHGRNYTTIVTVPGIHTDPTQMDPEKLWYRKEITLPAGNWKYATLELKGARFSPEVYVNGVSVSRQNGGMAPTFHLLKHKDIKPGRKITLEIALTSLKDIPETDASYIPAADQWRSNISSCLWNDVVLKVHGEFRIDRIIPFVDFNDQKADIAFDISNIGVSKMRSLKAVIEIIDNSGKVLIYKGQKASLINNRITASYGNSLRPWSPGQPNMYRLRVSLTEGKDTVDQSVIPFGIRDFRIINKQFYLNNKKTPLLGGTVVWHRWVRDPEARNLAYDTKWFTENVIVRLKEHGANLMRYHLGVPPEAFLDLCDEYGLAVQYEWSFFHGMPASRESLMEQYPRWLDMAMRHPSVVLIHPYNETEGDQLNIVWDALNEIVKEYPPLVMEERDVIHVHKYWWSLFENLGLYYDSADQFPKAIMVDEFGGNYLDGEGMMGGYTTVPETFLRFLGRDHTRESRLAFQTVANASVAEYWRRIGAAGISPFCILGSRNDGSHWYLGDLKEGNPKPVWNALTCAWSPRSASIELWDRNFVPGQRITLPVYLFNDMEVESVFSVKISIKDSIGKIYTNETHNYTGILPHSTRIKYEQLALPTKPGKYIISAELINRPEAVKYPVISQWEINVFESLISDVLLKPDISVAADEPEIIQFLNTSQIKHVSVSDPSSNIILLSREGWEKIARADRGLLDNLEQAVNRGASVIILDAGDRYLGQGYPKDKNDLGPLQGVAKTPETPAKTYNLFGGIKLTFREAAEPESHIHADKNNSLLWKNIPADHTWLWNGMRGGLIVPATSFMFTGLSSSAFLSQWLPRGADESKIRNDAYYAYELEGFYEFSDNPNDGELKGRLKRKLTFLVEDAPALASSLNPNTPVRITDLSNGYKESQNGMGESLIPLANSGKNLTRSPVIMINFGQDKGNLIVSQLLTAGRIAPGYGEDGLYGIRYDVVAKQFVLNMMELVLLKQ